MCVCQMRRNDRPLVSDLAGCLWRSSFVSESFPTASRWRVLSRGKTAGETCVQQHLTADGVIVFAEYMHFCQGCTLRAVNAAFCCRCFPSDFFVAGIRTTESRTRHYLFHVFDCQNFGQKLFFSRYVSEKSYLLFVIVDASVLTQNLTFVAYYMIEKFIIFKPKDIIR